MPLHRESRCYAKACRCHTRDNRVTIETFYSIVEHKLWNPFIIQVGCFTVVLLTFWYWILYPSVIILIFNFQLRTWPISALCSSKMTWNACRVWDDLLSKVRLPAFVSNVNDDGTKWSVDHRILPFLQAGISGWHFDQLQHRSVSRRTKLQWWLPNRRQQVLLRTQPSSARSDTLRVCHQANRRPVQVSRAMHVRRPQKENIGTEGLCLWIRWCGQRYRSRSWDDTQRNLVSGGRIGSAVEGQGGAEGRDGLVRDGLHCRHMSRPGFLCWNSVLLILGYSSNQEEGSEVQSYAYPVSTAGFSVGLSYETISFHGTTPP